MLPLQTSDPATGVLLATVFAGPFLGIGAFVAYRGLEALRNGVTLWRSDPVSVLEAANASGVVELVGTAAVAGRRQLRSPFADEPCLVYEWTVEEYDSSGDDSSWETVASDREQLPFLLDDGTGSIRVEPAGAELGLADGETVEVGRSETADEPIRSSLEALDVEPGDGSEASLGPLSVSTGDRRRYSERRLDVGETVHVYGPAEQDFTVADEAGEVNAVVRDDAGDGLFLISDTDESSTIRRSLVGGLLLVGFGVVFGVVGLFATMGIVF